MEICLNTFRVVFILFHTGVMAGSPCPIEVMRKIIADMNCSEMTVSLTRTFETESPESGVLICFVCYLSINSLVLNIALCSVIFKVFWCGL